MDLSLQELEAAINYWRAQKPAHGNEYALSPEVRVLATVYALMIYRRQKSVQLTELNLSAQNLLHAWRRQQPLTEPASHA